MKSNQIVNWPQINKGLKFKYKEGGVSIEPKSCFCSIKVLLLLGKACSMTELCVCTQRRMWTWPFVSAGSRNRAEEWRRHVAPGLHGNQVSEARRLLAQIRVRHLPSETRQSLRPSFFFFFWRAVPSVSRPLRSALPRWHVTFIWFDSSLFSLIDTPPFFLKQPPFYFYFSLFVYLIPSSNSWSYSLSFEGHLALPISLLCQRSRLHHSQTIITAASTAGSKA